MPLSYRIVCSCLFALFFFIMLAVKLDRKTEWNWFLVFLPLWIFDATFLALLIFRLVTNLRTHSSRDTSRRSLLSEHLFFVGLAMKICFEILLCLKLQYVDETLKTFYVFIPLWVLLIIGVIQLFPWAEEVVSIFQRGAKTGEASSASKSTQSVKRGPVASGLSNTVGAHPRSVGSRSSYSS